MIRVLVAEDSPTMRELLIHTLKSDRGIEVVGSAKSGVEAVAMARDLAPDLITMDIEMPGMNGIEATRAIMRESPTRIIIISNLFRDGEVALSLEATRAGALMVLPKPGSPTSPGFPAQRHQILSMVRAMSGVKVVRRLFDDPGPTHPRRTPDREQQRPVIDLSHIRVVTIAASTGGPAALSHILAELPPNYPVPILVVQHIAIGFVGGLARWLGDNTKLGVTIATEGAVALPGTVYIAPDDNHLGLGVGLRLSLSRAAPVGSFRPSGTHLFESAARSIGSGVLAVILTGMGDDGVKGLRAVKAAGGRIIAQDEASSIVYGMPREAVRAGVVDAVVPLSGIARALMDIAKVAA